MYYNSTVILHDSFCTWFTAVTMDLRVNVEKRTLCTQRVFMKKCFQYLFSFATFEILSVKVFLNFSIVFLMVEKTLQKKP